MTAADPTPAPPLNLHEYEAAARAVLPPMVFDFVAGGSRRRGHAARQPGGVRPLAVAAAGAARRARGLDGDLSPGSASVALPVLIAPSSLHRLCHDEGERATARAAKAAGTIYTMSTPASIALEDVAPEAGPWWFQLYVFRDRGLTRELVARAAAAGAAALVVTVDMPAARAAGGGRAQPLRPATRRDDAQHPGVEFSSSPQEKAQARGWITAAPVVEPALTWDDLDWLAALSPLPVVPKGILHPDDAAAAVEHGARAVIVSNHGGRQLDGAVATLDALPAVVEAVAGRAEVLLDGGVRRGTDVLKALALGARAVLIGRPVRWGLAVGGEAGVRHVLELLRAELALDLMLCGLASPEEVDRSLLVPAGTPVAR